MKTKLRFFVFLLLSVVLLFAVSCGDEATTTTTGNSEPPAPETPEIVPTPEGQISTDELTLLQIVYPMGNESAYRQNAVAIAEAIKETLDVEVEVVPDGYSTEKTYEILVGPCKNRKACENISIDRNRDYFWKIEGKQIVIAAGSVDGLNDATNAFVSRVVNAYGGNGTFYLSSEQDYTYSAQYAADSAVLGKVDLLDCVIVYPRSSLDYERETAQEIAESLLNLTGYTVPILQDGKTHTATYELHVGLTSKSEAMSDQTPTEEGGYLIFETEFGAAVLAESAVGYYAAKEAFLDTYVAENAVDKTVSVPLDTPVSGSGAGTMLRVMSFNVHYIDPDYGAIDPARVPYVIETIRRADVDVIGLQEVTPEWKAYLLEHLSDEYAFLGEGRDGGEEGEHSAILYRKDKFDLLETDTLWLSPYPDIPSRYPESSLNRIMTYAKLQRKSDGAVFVHINTHLDHKSEEARDKQIQHVLTLADSFKGLPVFLTGDFNTTSKKNVYHVTTARGYADSAEVALHAVDAPTAPSSGTVIDFCFVSKEILVTDYYVDTTKYMDRLDYPSDHNPIIVEMIFKN